MIDRDEQVITSPFGWRKGFLRKHKGVDLRSWDDEFKNRLPAILPVECKFIRQTYQKKWGWTYVFETVDKELLKFTHIQSEQIFDSESFYPDGTIVGYSCLTDYMREHNFYEHLHFEYWPKGKAENPIVYFKKLGKKWRFA